jgi:glutathione S-transferase
MAAEIFLHHYPASLFSEKIRLMLGYLGVPWNSVEIPSIMPRPLLMPLTGGYRKTPTLQIGANVYCDTAVITTALVRYTGDQSLYAPGFVARRVAEWADTALFRTTVALNFRPEAIGAFMGQLSPEEVAAFQEDRAQLTGSAPIVSIPPAAAIAAVGTYLTQLDNSLQTPFLFGEQPSIADFSVYHCIWFIDNPVNAEFIEPHANVRAWLSRMAAFGHGEVAESGPEAALEHARVSEPVAPEVTPMSIPGVAPGDNVTATPTDYGQIPVAGQLIAASAEEIVLKRDDPEAGMVMTHFPNVGILLEAG